MPKFMIVGKVDGAAFTLFKDDYNEAISKMAEIECGLAGYTELYVRDADEYRFMEA